MKKLLAMILAMIMLLSLDACTGNGDDTKPSESIEINTGALVQDATMDASKTYKKEITMATWAPISDIDPHFGLTNTIHRVY